MYPRMVGAPAKRTDNVAETGRHRGTMNRQANFRAMAVIALD
jgi:hypothetical protein